MNGKRKAIALGAALFFLVSILMGPVGLAAGARNTCGGGGHSCPPAPGCLKLTEISDTQASLTWSAPRDTRGISGYNVYRGGQLVGTAAGTSFTDTALTPNVFYTWTVKAVDASQRTSEASNAITAATLIIVRDEVEWTPDTAPRTVNGGLIVEASGHLQIDAGVVVKLLPGVRAQVSGMVDAAGTPDAPVVFTSSLDKAYGGRGVRSASDYWDTLSIPAGGSITGSNVGIFYGGTLATVQGTLSLTDSEAGFAKTMGVFVDTQGELDGIRLNLHDCCSQGSCRGIDAKGMVNLSDSRIHDCPGTGVLVEATGEFNGTSVFVTNCKKGVEIRGNVNFVLSGVSGCTYGLYFNTTQDSALILNSLVGNNKYGVYNGRPKDVTIDASMNWWGSPDGPSVYDPTTRAWSKAGDRVSAGVLYDNWLTAAP